MNPNPTAPAPFCPCLLLFLLASRLRPVRIPPASRLLLLLLPLLLPSSSPLPSLSSSNDRSVIVTNDGNYLENRRNIEGMTSYWNKFWKVICW